MNLKEQRYVCKLAKTGNLSLAAKELYISQPALSLYISNLEKSLGVKIFERVGKKFVPTYMGELYIEKAQQMLDLKNTFDLELSSFTREYKERLKVGMQDIRSNHLSPKLIKIFTDLHPNIDLIWHEANYQHMEDMLMNNQIDILFCNCPCRKKGLSYIPIRHDKLLFAVNKDNPLNNEAITVKGRSHPWIDLRLFKDERFILLNENQSLYSYSKEMLDAHNMTPQNIFRVSKVMTMMHLVNYGYGVGFCPENYLVYSYDIKNVSMYDVGISPLSIEFSGVYLKDRKISPYCFEIADILKSIV
ncbi:MAG: LysR family transcriptional regulator [Tissierellales bacterium]|nr:LysR family transcriptional regulator [Tissierellales bacterium]MBN2826360.1 LysR family transcriptional regulator [Tissierellales bacterium]